MNELFYNWHRTLNKKKVFLCIGIFLIILIVVILLVKPKETQNTKSTLQSIAKVSDTHTIYYDKEHSISIELLNSYNLKAYLPSNNYLIELRSEDNLDIFVSKKDFINGKNLEKVVHADQKAFIESFENTSNPSEIKQLNINDHNAFTYSFHYLDKKQNQIYYLQVTWIEYEDSYYIFDIEFPLDNLENYTNIITDTLSSFKKI